jgi:serine/threonine protein kinase
MAYAPKDYQEVYDGVHPPFSERAPRDVHEEKERFLHRDIDPQNSMSRHVVLELVPESNAANQPPKIVLVGGIGLGSGHPLVPGLKLGDFGLSGDLSGRKHLLDG